MYKQRTRQSRSGWQEVEQESNARCSIMNARDIHDQTGSAREA